MDLRPYTRADFPALNALYPSPEDSLPEIGYVFTINEVPVAFGFLRKVEGGFCQLDTFASNPKFSSEERHIAISFITDELIQRAKDLNLKGILAFTTDYSIIKRAEDIGFRSLKHTLVALKLRE